MAYDDTSGMGIDPRFMKGGSNYGGAMAAPKQSVGQQFLQSGTGKALDWISALNPFTAAAWHGGKALYNIIDPAQQPHTPYDTPETFGKHVASSMDQPAASDADLARANEEYWKIATQKEADAQWVREQHRNMYNALMDPNNPNVQQAQNYGFTQAAAGAAKRGIQGPMSMAAARNQSEAMGRDRLAQNQQMAMGALAGMGSRVDADRSAVMGALQAIGSQKLAAMGIDMRRVEMLLNDEHYRNELKMAMDAKDEERFWRILNIGLKLVSSGAGGM